MKSRRQLWTGIIASLGLLTMIIDSKIALAGAREGVELCLNTVIPSLFPFFILSTLINRSLAGSAIRFMQPICKACGIPPGAESVFLLGLLGGYPVGAQAINEAYANRSLDKQDAQRMLGFCNNAGPAFIFGMVGSLFTQPLVPWIIWLIQIFSAVLVGCVLPQKSQHKAELPQYSQVSLSSAVERSIKTMANVCGWVIVFRVLNTFCLRWFLWILPQKLQISIIGAFELSNGCFALNSVALDGARFVLGSAMLSLGGVCVAMQTTSVTKEVGTGSYFLGKLLQTLISILLAGTMQQFLFPAGSRWHIPAFVYLTILSMTAMLLFLLYGKKSSRNFLLNRV